MAVPDHAKISDMRNLGPTVERDMREVGIETAGQLRELGAEEAFLLMLEGRMVAGRGANGVNAAYLYALYGAIEDIDWRELAEDVKADFKTWTAQLRDSGRYES